MAVRGAAASSLLLKRGFDRRREEELLKVFKDADTNQDGFLSVDEYVNVFRQRGIAITADEVKMYFNSKDRDRDGLISFDEFCDRETINERSFRAIDQDEDGFITKEDMILAFRMGSRRLSRSDVDYCFKEFDKDHDNRLSYNEFCALMNSHRQASEDIQVAASKRIEELETKSEGEIEEEIVSGDDDEDEN